jgi:hypothetical protein
MSNLIQHLEEYNDGAYVLLCPNCGGDYLHQVKTQVFEREEDSDEGQHITVERTTFSFNSDIRDNPSPRRQGITIEFTCEMCDSITYLHVYQHKGQTILSLELSEDTKIVVKNLEQTTEACPSQWEGEDIEGNKIYIRYRHGGLRLDVNGDSRYSMSYGDNWDGCMDTDKMLELLESHLDISNAAIKSLDDTEWYDYDPD